MPPSSDDPFAVAPMTAVTSSNFGLLVAYVIPGFTVIAAASTYVEIIQTWLGADATANATIGGFLYATIASVAAGMTVSAIRWLLLDWLHHHTGIVPPQWDLAVFSERLGGFEVFVEHHYRYYQFYGNMLVAMVILLMWHKALLVLLPLSPSFFAGGMAALMVLFYLASRDALQKYYLRTNLLLTANHLYGSSDDDQRMQNQERRHASKIGRQESRRPPRFVRLEGSDERRAGG